MINIQNKENFFILVSGKQEYITHILRVGCAALERSKSPSKKEICIII